jgi:hypothetical protein
MKVPTALGSFGFHGAWGWALWTGSGSFGFRSGSGSLEFVFGLGSFGFSRASGSFVLGCFDNSARGVGGSRTGFGIPRHAYFSPFWAERAVGPSRPRQAHAGRERRRAALHMALILAG